MTECSTAPTQVGFSFFSPQVVTAAFDHGAVTSNAGVALLAQLDRQIRWTERIAGCLQEGRDERFVQHSCSAALVFASASDFSPAMTWYSIAELSFGIR